MKKTGCLAIALFVLLKTPAGADIISGIVIDSASGKRLARVKVGTDSTHYVLSDSLGGFVFDTNPITGIRRHEDGLQQGIVWDHVGDGFLIPECAGPLDISIRNIRGDLVKRMTVAETKTQSEVALPMLPVGVYTLSIHGAGETLTQSILNIRGNAALAFRAVQKTSGVGLALRSANPAVTILKFKKPTYYPATTTYNGSQSNVVVKLQEDFSPSRHDYLTAAEWQCVNGDCETHQKMYLVRGGRVVWTYTEPLPAEYDDAWMLSDGSIVMSLRYGARKIKSIADTSTQWYIYENIRTQGEIHVTQPLNLNTVFVWVNEGSQTTGLIINTQNGDTVKNFKIPCNNGGFHGNGRHARYTKDGTLMVTHFDLGKVVEYDTATMREIWSYTGRGWAGVKLPNGNLLLSGDGAGWVREINRATKNVDWEVNVNSLPNVTPGQYVQGILRLSNGNTIINNHKGNPSILEVSPDKRVVWSVSNTLIPNSTTVQVLDDEGIPEKPGDLLR